LAGRERDLVVEHATQVVAAVVGGRRVGDGDGRVRVDLEGHVDRGPGPRTVRPEQPALERLAGEDDVTTGRVLPPDGGRGAGRPDRREGVVEVGLAVEALRLGRDL